MSTDTPTIEPPSEERLAEALQEYQAALDSGLPMDRDALLRRFPDVPELADDLDALDALQGVERELHPEEATGPRLDDFEILREIGRGGMGVVYEARHRSLDRRVAIKVLTRAAGMDPLARQRFLHEGRVAALIDHPNVVPVFQVGEADGVPFYVMPLIDGESLAAVIRRNGPDEIPFRSMARIGLQAAEALAAAHVRDIVHRDIKPGNVLLDAAGKAWIVDFGLAETPFADGLTRTGARLGTPRYMSPEQITGPRDRVDSRTDIYSLGITLYELLTSKPAFAGDSETDLLQRIINTEPPKPSQINPAVPPDLETVVLKASARDPADRYQSSTALADDLRRFLEHRPVLARRPTMRARLRKWLRRNRRPVAITATTLIAGALLGLGTSTLVVWSAYRAEQTARAHADRNLTLAMGALSDLGAMSDEVVSHSASLQRRRLAILENMSERLAPFADDRSLPISVRREIAIIEFRRGFAMTDDRDPDERIASFRRAKSRFDALSTEDPDNAELWYDRAEAGQSLARQMDAFHPADDVERLRNEALWHSMEAERRLPGRPEPRLMSALLRTDIANCRESRNGPPGSALPTMLDELRLHEELRDRYPVGHPRSYMRLALTWIYLAHKYESLGRLDDAENAWRSAVSNHQHLVEHFAHEPFTVRDQSQLAGGGLALLLFQRGKLVEAEQRFQNCLHELERAAAADPDNSLHSSSIVSFCLRLASVRHAGGDLDAARAACELCRTSMRKHGSRCNPYIQAEALLLLPLAEFRDPRRANEIVSHDRPDRRSGLQALARYRIEDYAAALKIAEDSKYLINQIVRPACLVKLGRLDEARRELDQVIPKLKSPPLLEPLFVPFLREVEELATAGR